MYSMNKPIFQYIFGEQWQHLPQVMRKHYANRPYSKDVVTVKGVMKIEVSTYAKLLSPFLRIAGALVPYPGDNIPVTVRFYSEQDTDVYSFHRIFHFTDRPAYHFRSHMVHVGSNKIIEFMPIGIGWNASYRYDGQKVLIEHCGYKMKLFGYLIKLPLELLLGKGYAEEEALSDNRFRMYMDIKHPIFGKVYSYMGEFSVSEVALSYE
mgnify:CR=1 FL=1